MIEGLAAADGYKWRDCGECHASPIVQGNAGGGGELSCGIETRPRQWACFLTDSADAAPGVLAYATRSHTYGSAGRRSRAGAVPTRRPLAGRTLRSESSADARSAWTGGVVGFVGGTAGPPWWLNNI